MCVGGFSSAPVDDMRRQTSVEAVGWAAIPLDDLADPERPYVQIEGASPSDSDAAQSASHWWWVRPASHRRGLYET